MILGAMNKASEFGGSGQVFNGIKVLVNGLAEWILSALQLPFGGSLDLLIFVVMEFLGANTQALRMRSPAVDAFNKLEIEYYDPHFNPENDMPPQVWVTIPPTMIVDEEEDEFHKTTWASMVHNGGGRFSLSQWMFGATDLSQMLSKERSATGWKIKKIDGDTLVMTRKKDVRALPIPAAGIVMVGDEAIRFKSSRYIEDNSEMELKDIQRGYDRRKFESRGVGNSPSLQNLESFRIDESAPQASDIVDSEVYFWSISPMYRVSILDPNFLQKGIGFEIDDVEDGKVTLGYIMNQDQSTQDFQAFKPSVNWSFSYIKDNHEYRATIQNFTGPDLDWSDVRHNDWKESASDTGTHRIGENVVPPIPDDGTVLYHYFNPVRVSQLRFHESEEETQSDHAQTV